MKSAIVKPIPPRALPPARTPQVSCAGRTAIPMRTASQQNAMIPAGLPTTNAMRVATVTEASSALEDSGSPALASANSGMMRKPTQG
jgi:hypothetical protein